MIIEGILSIQAGDNPRIVEEKLRTFLDPASASTSGRQGEPGRSTSASGRRPRWRGRSSTTHEHPDERWLLTYADMITLLMALFMVLYAMSMVNKTKFEALRTTLKQSFSGAILTGGTSILDHGAVSSSQTQAQSDLTGKDTPVPDAFAPAPVAQQTAQSAAKQSATAARQAQLKQEQQLDAAKAKVDRAIRAAHLEGKAKTILDPRRGLVIRLITDDVLFGLGKYVLRPEGYPLLTSIAHAIQPLPNAVRVEGYTDTLPCSCFFGNEGLSFARADTVLHFLGSHGFTIGDRHDAVPVAYGDRYPLSPNSSTTGNPRNRRVEIVILRNQFGTGTAAAGPLGDPIGTGAISAHDAVARQVSRTPCRYRDSRSPCRRRFSSHCSRCCRSSAPAGISGTRCSSPAARPRRRSRHRTPC